MHPESLRQKRELIYDTSAREQNLNDDVVVDTKRIQSIKPILNEATETSQAFAPGHHQRRLADDIHDKHLQIGDAVINGAINRGGMGEFQMKSYPISSKNADALQPGYKGRMSHGNSLFLTEPISKASMLQNQSAGRPNFTLVGDSVSVNNLNNKIQKPEKDLVVMVDNSAPVKPVQTKIDIKNSPLPRNQNFHHGTTNFDNHVLATFGGLEERNRGGKLEARLPMSFTLTGKTVSGQRPENAEIQPQDYLVIHTENGVSVNPIPNRIMNVPSTSNVGERRLHAFVQPSYFNGNGTAAQKVKWKTEKNAPSPFFLTGKGVSAEKAPKNGKTFQNNLKIQRVNDSVLWKGDPVQAVETTPLSHFGESRPGAEARFQPSRLEDMKERHFGVKSIRDTGTSFFTVGKGVNIQRNVGQDTGRNQELVMMQTGNGVSVKHPPISFNNMASTANLGGIQQSIGFKPIQKTFSQLKVNNGRLQAGQSERKMRDNGFMPSALAGKGMNAQRANYNFKDGLRILTGSSVSVRPDPHKFFGRTHFQNQQLFPSRENFGQLSQGGMNGRRVGEKIGQNEEASFSLIGEGDKMMDVRRKGSSLQHPWEGRSMAPLRRDKHGPMGSNQDTKELTITSRPLQGVKIGKPPQIFGQNKPHLKEDLNHQIHLVKIDNTEIALKGNTPYAPKGLQPFSSRNYGHAKGGVHNGQTLLFKDPSSFQGRIFLHQTESRPSSDFAFKNIKPTQPNFKGKTQSFGFSSESLLVDKPVQVSTVEHPKHPRLAGPSSLSMGPGKLKQTIGKLLPNVLKWRTSFQMG